MKVQLDRDQLRRLGGVFHGLLPRRTKKILPVLSHVLLEARDGALFVTGTDLDTWATIRLNATVLDTGSLSVPLHALRDVARVLPAGDLWLGTGSRRVHDEIQMPTLVLSREDLHFELEGLVEDEFPRPQTFTSTHEIAVPALTLFQLFGAVGFAISREEHRPILNGVQWETHEDRLVFCATNGHRLATMEAPAAVAAIPEMIVVPKALQAAQKLFPSDAELRITRSAERIAFEATGHRVISRLIDGPYPNWRQIMPGEANHVATFDRAALLAAMERALVIARDFTRRTVLFLGTTDPDEGWLSTWSDTYGKYGERIPLVEPMEGPAITIGINAGYASELLKRVPTPQVRMRFTSPERAILMEPVGDAAPTLTLLQMPLRLIEEPLTIPWQHIERKVA